MFLYKVDKSIDRFPFQTLENEDAIPDIKWIHVANKENEAIIICDKELSYGVSVTSLEGYLSTLDRQQILKKDIVEFAYKPDVENKILRDAAAGRNLNEFSKYDNFIESIPGS